MLGLCLSSKLHLTSYITLFAKTGSPKIKLWFVLWHFFLLRFSSLPYPFAWNNVVISGLVLPFSTWICWINYENGYVAHCQLLTSLSLFYRCYFGHVPLKLLYWFHFLFYERSTCYSNRSHDYSAIISKSYKDV